MSDALRYSQRGIERSGLASVQGCTSRHPAHSSFVGIRPVSISSARRLKSAAISVVLAASSSSATLRRRSASHRRRSARISLRVRAYVIAAGQFPAALKIACWGDGGVTRPFLVLAPLVLTLLMAHGVQCGWPMRTSCEQLGKGGVDCASTDESGARVHAACLPRRDQRNHHRHDYRGRPAMTDMPNWIDDILGRLDPAVSG